MNVASRGLSVPAPSSVDYPDPWATAVACDATTRIDTKSQSLT